MEKYVHVAWKINFPHPINILSHSGQKRTGYTHSHSACGGGFAILFLLAHKCKLKLGYYNSKKV
ncbi:hypothetical protein [Blautia sp.]|uniref:hypothetical protein n=1 Tax=Blautia sp. TaxID=1955243 RepID=UPI002E7880AF|nr:hypothetical protein [Blautia sp.]